MTRLVCVSNRVALPRRDASSGGLAVGVLAALKQTGGLWFGWGGEKSDGEPPETDVLTRDNLSYATVELPRRDFDRYYNGFSNSTLWPLFHYLLRDFCFNDEQYQAYLRVNRFMARRLAPLLQEDDLVWIHDYHLIPLAENLREAGVTQPLGFFLHIPFPHIDMLRVLPTYAELLSSLAKYDVVGFQTETDVQAFRAGVELVWGKAALSAPDSITVDGRRVQVGAFPIGIDVDAVHDAAENAMRSDVVKRMIASLQERRLMIGVDRLDYSKGLMERFAAYQTFLESYPENLSKLTFMQIAPLSRTNVNAYAEIRRSLEQQAGRINGRFADADWTPIRYLNKNIPHAQVTGFLRAAQVALVTPVRDGMNLVAKEFIAAQNQADPGVLILSNLAGAAHELRGALPVNPYDTRGVAHAIQTALAMPLTERRARHAQMMEVMRRNDVGAWCRRFIEALQAVN
jgi:trehalose 6-phosphate synthase